MILQGETSRGAGRGKTELIDYFFPKFVMRDRLSSSLLTDGFVELVEIELLTSDLRNFDLSDTLRGPVLRQVLLKFVLLF